MYDTVICEIPIEEPDGLAEWQTKSMECQDSTYRIDWAGLLWRKGVDEKDFRPIFYTGDIQFLGWEENPDGELGRRWMYTASFHDGELMNLKQDYRAFDIYAHIKALDNSE